MKYLLALEPFSLWGMFIRKEMNMPLSIPAVFQANASRILLLSQCIPPPSMSFSRPIPHELPWAVSASHRPSLPEDWRMSRRRQTGQSLPVYPPAARSDDQSASRQQVAAPSAPAVGIKYLPRWHPAKKLLEGARCRAGNGRVSLVPLANHTSLSLSRLSTFGWQITQ
jgi:hypothetical protein